MRIAAAQMNIAWHDRAANQAKARGMARDAAEAGADLLLLPEMFATGFSMDTNVTAEPWDGPTIAFLRKTARETGLHVAGGLVLKDGPGRPANISLVVAPDGSVLSLYRKIHQIGILQEDRHYAPGRVPDAFDLPPFRAACLICYDLRFPELFRALSRRCGLFLVIASWPSGRQRHWDLLVPARAVENQAYVAAVNRVGEGGGHAFAGGSAIVAPTGETLAKAGGEETLIVADLEAGEVSRIRELNPFLKDRKPLREQADWEAAGGERSTGD